MAGFAAVCCRKVLKSSAKAGERGFEPPAPARAKRARRSVPNQREGTVGLFPKMIEGNGRPLCPQLQHLLFTKRSSADPRYTPIFSEAAQRRSARRKALRGGGREILRLRALRRFAQDFRLRAPARLRLSHARKSAQVQTCPFRPIHSPARSAILHIGGSFHRLWFR